MNKNGSESRNNMRITKFCFLDTKSLGGSLDKTLRKKKLKFNNCELIMIFLLCLQYIGKKNKKIKQKNVVKLQYFFSITSA